MNYEEFLDDKQVKEPESETFAAEEALSEPEELDVQKAVVEELAADKAKLDLQMEEMSRRIASLEADLAAKSRELEEAVASKNSAIAEIEASFKAKIAEIEQKLAVEQERHFDEQARNPNALALLDRDMELPDRFPGETRDHVLEVVKEARDAAEAEGRLRRAQLLESVLVANEPNGELGNRRKAIKKLFDDNGNILSGPVIEELDRLGISYKDGEKYLLATEILKRTY